MRAGGPIERLTSAGGDDEILALVALAGEACTVAINAPLTLPRGRCCLVRLHWYRQRREGRDADRDGKREISQPERKSEIRSRC